VSGSAAYVAGVGMTRFGRFPERAVASLGREAGLAALRDAGVEPSAVQAVVCGSARSGTLLGRESGLGQLVGWELGIRHVPVHNLKNYCASGADAMDVGRTIVQSGDADVVLVLGVEKMSQRRGRGAALTSDGMEVEGDLGFSPPGYFGLLAQRHMAEYGTTREQLAMVAVKNRRMGAMSPYPQYRDTVTVEDVLDSRPMVGVLNLLDCCPTTDGAAAVVLVSEAVADRVGRARLVRVSTVLRSGLYDQVKDATTFDLDVRTAHAAYERAGIGPEDVDVAEVHDAFTIAEIVHYEDLGFCAKGDGGKLVHEGVTDLGGRLPVSTGGGLMSRGHPLGATGVAQVVEVATQLRGEAGERQVEGARVGLTHVAGGFMEGDIATSGIAVLSR
jgi:acetyl-CoA acetyltransferase